MRKEMQDKKRKIRKRERERERERKYVLRYRQRNHWERSDVSGIENSVNFLAKIGRRLSMRAWNTYEDVNKTSKSDGNI